MIAPVETLVLACRVLGQSFGGGTQSQARLAKPLIRKYFTIKSLFLKDLRENSRQVFDSKRSQGEG